MWSALCLTKLVEVVLWLTNTVEIVLWLTNLVKVVLKVSQQADVEGRDPLLVHYSFTLEERSTQLLKLLQTLGHVSDLHGIPDGLDQVGQLLEPAHSTTSLNHSVNILK